MLEAMSCYTRVVEEGAEVLALVGEREYGRPGDAVVLAAVMASAMGLPDHLELLEDPVYAVGQQAGERQVAEGPELLHLVFG